MLEAVETARAVVRPVATVLPAVGDQVGALAEGLPTDLTHMRFLPSVYKSVFLHVRLLVEPLAAVLARIRPDV